MLLELTIRNIALIESLHIDFVQGFNVLTGETGSGKSIVVDCVNLVLGGRAERDFVRTGAEKGSVQALFDISNAPHAQALARELGVECDDNLIAVMRELSVSGRNICRISGVIVPLSTLKRLSGMLLDLHGQHEHQSLLNPAKHISFLDSFGDGLHRQFQQNVAVLYRERMAIASALKKLLSDSNEKERLLDMLTFQVNEIASARLKVGEEEKLDAKLRVLENSERIRDSVERAYILTYQGDGRSMSAQEALLASAESMNAIASIDERYAALSARLREAYDIAQDIGYELQAMMDSVSNDPELLEKIANRLDLIHRLERKYGANIPDVLAFYEEASERLKSIQTSDEHIEAQKKALRKIDGELKAACEALTASRKTLAERLKTEIMRELNDLGMAKTRFEVGIQPEAKPSADGADRVEFLISPNPGEPVKPLASIASGGELSRIMLAFKAISMDTEGVESMVFDEIDTGISGRMAQVVGEKMCRIANERQVLCVTHLPQIAALGNAHYLVEKKTDGKRTDTHVRRLDEKGRILEISRLVGGSEDSESSLNHAKHMLQDAAHFHKTINAGE